ncbi:hypothetical protein FVE67_04610 [Thermosulfurimonas marina]|uniref:Uncharacterized protein n=1 Tax=Thermosulfurimonas marina TaxID=2047767 RepID=A0A6H1WSH6_9BACT|nr:hypothetical protein [Thermosulfurimonas marina]QJA06121.1 hypothetical protein FVE67_04610 [Thermosulfurimonas marina]
MERLFQELGRWFYNLALGVALAILVKSLLEKGLPRGDALVGFWVVILLMVAGSLFLVLSENAKGVAQCVEL